MGYAESRSEIVGAGTKAKSPLGEWCASGLGFPMSVFWLSVVPRRHAHRMVMMVMAMGQRSHREHDIRAVEMWLSIYCWVRVLERPSKSPRRLNFTNRREGKKAWLSF